MSALVTILHHGPRDFVTKATKDAVVFFGWYSDDEGPVEPKPLMVGVGRERDDAIEFLQRVRDDSDVATKVIDLADATDH
jgi:hypothetical protein